MSFPKIVFINKLDLVWITTTGYLWQKVFCYTNPS
jgi:hypothetical protein